MHIQVQTTALEGGPHLPPKLDVWLEGTPLVWLFLVLEGDFIGENWRTHYTMY